MKHIREKAKRRMEAIEITEGWFDGTEVDKIPDGMLIDVHRKTATLRDYPGTYNGEVGQMIVRDNGRLHFMEAEQFEAVFEDDPDTSPVAADPTDDKSAAGGDGSLGAAQDA